MSMTAKQKIDEAAQQVEDKANSAIETARDGAHSAREQVSEIASNLRKSATSGAENARETLTEAGDKIVGTLRSTAETASTVPSRVYESVSEGMSSVAETLRKRDLGEIVGDAKDYAHRNPGTVAIGAAVAGFALAHLLRAATRQSTAEKLYSDAARRASDVVSRVREGGWRG
jgi:plasmid stabilization system protein ParE